jgi:hypothetical protein
VVSIAVSVSFRVAGVKAANGSAAAGVEAASFAAGAAVGSGAEVEAADWGSGAGKTFAPGTARGDPGTGPALAAVVGAGSGGREVVLPLSTSCTTRGEKLVGAACYRGGSQGWQPGKKQGV